MVRKKKISITLDPSVVTQVDELKGDGEEYDNRSEAIGELVEIALDHDTAIEAKEEEIKAREQDIERLEAENERLENRVQKVIAMHNERDELVAYVEENRTLQRQKHEATAVERLKWLVFGGDE